MQASDINRAHFYPKWQNQLYGQPFFKIQLGDNLQIHRESVKALLYKADNYRNDKDSKYVVDSLIKHIQPVVLRTANRFCGALYLGGASELPIATLLPCNKIFTNVLLLCTKDFTDKTDYTHATINPFDTKILSTDVVQISNLACPVGWIPFEQTCVNLVRSFVAKHNVSSTCNQNHSQTYSFSGGYNQQLLVISFLNMMYNHIHFERYVMLKTAGDTEEYVLVTNKKRLFEGWLVSEWEPVNDTAMPTHVLCSTIPLSTEIVIKCGPAQFLCDFTACMSDLWKCDGIFHCFDKADELACSPVCLINNRPIYNSSLCGTDCNSSTCVCGELYHPCTTGE